MATQDLVTKILHSKIFLCVGQEIEPKLACCNVVESAHAQILAHIKSREKNKSRHHNIVLLLIEG